MENKTNDTIKNRIFWKVYFIWFFRKILPIIAIQIAVFALALQLFAKNVFVSRVLQNIAQVAESGYWAVLKYVIASFLNTHFVTQVVILAILAIVALLVRDIGRSLLAYKSMWKR